MPPFSNPDSTVDVSPEFLAAFQAAVGDSGVLRFDHFTALALYDPAVGYYHRSRRRVGYGRGTDFFTASTSGPVFGELVQSACCKLLHGHDPRTFAFVEIGPEPGNIGEPSGGVLAGLNHPFASVRTITLGEPLELSGACIVFSNELFDAQPFRRFRFRDRQWRELGVRTDGAMLVLTELPGSVEEPFLPATAIEGHVVDAPLASVDLTHAIAAQPWQGLFVAADYGKSWRELAEMTPTGTARAYYRHTQSNDLLARPGEQDLTCHICWDWLERALVNAGFDNPTVESQEAFFIRHAGEYVADASAADAARLSSRKLSLMQLLHPSHLGQKFQVLHAWRAGSLRT